MVDPRTRGEVGGVPSCNCSFDGGVIAEEGSLAGSLFTDNLGREGFNKRDHKGSYWIGRARNSAHFSAPEKLRKEAPGLASPHE